MYTCAPNSVCGVMEPGFESTWPRSTSSFFVPRSNAPMLSPARPSSRSFLNISTPVHTVFVVGRNPTISISTPPLTMPRSTPAGDDGAPAGDREHVFDGHQERTVDLAHGLGD